MNHLPASAQPLQRLNVTDGLLINAQRWQLADAYHQQRQNLHFQACAVPGIVWGLGAAPITAPADVPTAYQDQRWLEIQPGMAIDGVGNVIVVPEPMPFRITTQVPTGTVLVYLVLRYVDPTQLQYSQPSEILTDTFRIDEINHPPEQGDIELCRIALTAGDSPLHSPADVFFPQENAIDVRHRPIVRTRPQAQLHMAEVLFASQPTLSLPLAALIQAAETLYPPLGVSAQAIPLEALSAKLPTDRPVDLRAYDLVHLRMQSSQSLSTTQLRSLQDYLTAGGCVWVAISPRGTSIQELLTLKVDLERTLIYLETTLGTTQAINPSVDVTHGQTIYQDITAELTHINQTLETKLGQLGVVFRDLADQLGDPMVPFHALSQTHPLRTQPFMFGALPTILNQPLQIWIGAGIILEIGDLATAWGLTQTESLPREIMRSAQELGINLLHYAGCRSHLRQLLHPHIQD